LSLFEQKFPATAPTRRATVPFPTAKLRLFFQTAKITLKVFATFLRSLEFIA
jgi:hypothetical protein